MHYLPYGVAAWIFCVGIYGAIVSRNLIHLAMCLAVTQSSTYILLLAIGYRKHGTAPVFKGFENRTRGVDPVVQALALTDVVVEAAVTALLLAFAVQAHKRFGTLDPQELVQFKG